MKLDDVILMIFVIPFLVALIAKLSGARRVWPHVAITVVLVLVIFVLTGGPW